MEETKDLLNNSPNAPVFDANDEIIDMGEDFDFNDYQVVRREFFAHIKEPSITFNECKVYVNTACLNKFPNNDYIKILVNSEKKTFAIEPCGEFEKDAFMWCNYKNGVRKPKTTSCKIFFAKIVNIMGWNPEHRYKMLGKLVHANGKYLIAFDLTAAETYRKVYVEGQKPKKSRTPVFPAEWQNQFGLPYNEHQRSMQINIFDGYAVYTIKDPLPQKPSVGEQLALPMENNNG